MSKERLNPRNPNAKWTLLLQWLVRSKRLKPWQLGVLLTIDGTREGPLEMTTCRSLEIWLTAFCRICDKRLSLRCYGTLGWMQRVRSRRLGIRRFGFRSERTVGSAPADS